MNERYVRPIEGIYRFRYSAASTALITIVERAQ